ncbi:26953_t:CDS:2, partial [Racocetra persica]
GIPTLYHESIPQPYIMRVSPTLYHEDIPNLAQSMQFALDAINMDTAVPPPYIQEAERPQERANNFQVNPQMNVTPQVIPQMNVTSQVIPQMNATPQVVPQMNATPQVDHQVNTTPQVVPQVVPQANPQTNTHDTSQTNAP